MNNRALLCVSVRKACDAYAIVAVEEGAFDHGQPTIALRLVVPVSTGSWYSVVYSVCIGAREQGSDVALN